MHAGTGMCDAHPARGEQYARGTRGRRVARPTRGTRNTLVSQHATRHVRRIRCVASTVYLARGAPGAASATYPRHRDPNLTWPQCFRACVRGVTRTCRWCNKYILAEAPLGTVSKLLTCSLHHESR